jgi:hypothetical protein
MQAIKADQAWKAKRFGSPEVTVAILDTGIDLPTATWRGVSSLLGRSPSSPQRTRSYNNSFRVHGAGRISTPMARTSPLQ